MLNFSSLSKIVSAGLRLAAWLLLATGFVLGMGWAALHFWIVPRIEDFRPKLESLASQTLGVPVKMRGLVAVSSGWMPTFEIHDLSLLDPEGRQALTLPKVIFAISIRSVMSLGVEQLVIESPSLDIRRTENGEWRIAGLSLKQDNTQDSAAADWIFAQKEIVIQRGTVNWTDEFDPLQRNKPTLNLTDVSWVLQNSARHHQWRLDAAPPSGWGDRFVFMGDIRRHLLSTHPGRVKDWNGQIHAEFPDVDLSKLGPHLPWKINATEGQGALRMWLDLSRGDIQQGTADLFLENAKAQLSPELDALSFKTIAGRVSVKSLDNGFDFSTQGLSFDTPNGLHWPGGNVSLLYTDANKGGGGGAKGVFHGDKLDLLALRNIALQLPLPAMARQTLREHKFSGQVNPLHVEWTEQSAAQGKRFDIHAAHGRFEGFSLEGGKAGTSAENWPGIENANISFEVTPEGGLFKASIEKGALSINKVFEDPRIPLDKLQASLKWQKIQGQLLVPEWQLSLSNPDLSGEWHGQWKPSPLPGSLGILDLQGGISRADASRVHRYLPLSVPQAVRDYIRSAVTKGEVQGVNVKVKGDLQNLPFANAKEGEFKFAGRVKDVQYAYVPTTTSHAGQNTNTAPTWPAMNSLSGELALDRLSLRINNASGRWGNVPFNQIKADIPNLSNRLVVNVQGESKANANLVLNELRLSPVNDMLSGALSQVDGTGQVNSRLKLSLPLAELEKSSVQGSVSLNNNDIRFQAMLPVFERSQGTLNFNESGFTLMGVTAQFLGGAVKLEGGSKKLPPGSSEANPLLRIQGQASAIGMREAKEIPILSMLAQHATGATSYTASLGFKGGQSELSVQSQLQGLALHLPSPLNKKAEDAVAIKFENSIQNVNSVSSGQALRDQVQIQWGRSLSANYVRDLSGNEPRVLNGRWQIGEPSNATLPGPDAGVAAFFNLPLFSVDDWLQVFSPPKSSQASNTPPTSKLSASTQAYLPTRMTLKANELVLQGRRLNQVVGSGSREGFLWRANLDAREFSGYLEYRQPHLQNSGRIYARLARLNLPPSADQAVESMLEESPLTIPALDIVVDELELRGKKLGRVEIEAVNTDAALARNSAGREWRLNKLNITVPEASFKASGKWITSRDGKLQANTEMNFKLDVADAGDLLNRLGTKDALRGGAGKLEGNVNWQGSPLTLHYPSMNGRINVNMGRGQFLQAEPGVAKLLGVLSLQALPRRLLLDFRDVFSAGFAFDTLRGDAVIQQGVASTRNLQMKGVNAVVQMEGSSDISRETQNLRVLVLPEVDAGTASLLAGIALNPAIGLSTFLAQLILKQPISRLNTQEFTIDGTWSDPKVTKVSSSAP